MEGAFRRRASDIGPIRDLVTALLDVEGDIRCRIDAFAYAFLRGAKNYDSFMNVDGESLKALRSRVLGWRQTLDALTDLERLGKEPTGTSTHWQRTKNCYLALRAIVGPDSARDERRALVVLLVTGPAGSDEIRDDLRLNYSLSRRVKALADGLGDLRALDRELLMRLFLSYRDLSAWDEMTQLYDAFPAALQDSAMACQQLALALNRRNGPGDARKAERMLEKLLKQHGGSAETYGILGRIYKDRFKAATKDQDPRAPALLDKAIDAYTRGFESEPADYYPGVNAITLLLQKGSEEAQREAERLTPLVSFAVARRGGAASSDYWDLATVLELAMVGRDRESAEQVLPRVLNAATASWMAETTANNLELIRDLRKQREDVGYLQTAIDALNGRAKQLTSD